MTKARTNADNASADIQGVTAGTGLSGGGTSGTVTLTNDMATTIAAKGDLVVGTANDTYAALTVGTNNQVLMADSAQVTGLKFANEATATLTAKGDVLTATGANTLSRLAVGANDTVLTADSTTATGLKWATPVSGGMTVIASGTLSGATFDISSIPGTYNYIQLVLHGFRNSTAGMTTYIKMNNTTAEGFYVGRKTSGTTYNNSLADNINPVGGLSTTDTDAIGVWTIYNYANASIKKMIVSEVEYRDSVDSTRVYYKGASINTGSSSAITSIRLDSSSTWSAGTYTLYGVK